MLAGSCERATHETARRDVAVVSNVALINYACDVPVKHLSFNLLLGAAVPAAGDIRRLIGVFLRNAQR